MEELCRLSLLTMLSELQISVLAFAPVPMWCLVIYLLALAFVPVCLRPVVMDLLALVFAPVSV